MKITSIRNVILTPECENVVKKYETLGFKVAHEKDEIGALKNNEVVLKSEGGDSLIVVGLKEMKQAFTATAFNVDNIEEAIKEFEAQEFSVVSSDIRSTNSSLGALLRSKEGNMVIVSEHLK